MLPEGKRPFGSTVIAQRGQESMRKRQRGTRPVSDEPLSAGRVEYLEQARERVRNRRIRRTALIVVALTLVVLFTTGIVGSSVAMAKDWADTARILLFPGTGWPQQTGVMEPTQVLPMTGGFVELGGDSCMVYSRTGTRLNSIQSGYARPALAAGKTRFVLYNRSGNELRVESRTQNLYSKTLENSIYLCAMSDTGTLAVATDSADSTARLTVYTSTMSEQLHWDMTSAQGTPVRMAFAADSRRLAVAAVTSSAGQLQANLFVLNLAQGDPVQLSSGDSVPQWLGWLNNDTVLAVYENCAVVYGADGGERGRFDLGGGSLVSVSQDGANAALLLENGQVCTAVLLDKDLNVQYSGNVPAANQILRRGQNFYLLTDSGVECFAADGVYQWGQELSVRPQALIAGKQLLVLCGNTVQQIAPPEQTASSAR